jgi:hypothetical protein
MIELLNLRRLLFIAPNTNPAIAILSNNTLAGSGTTLKSPELARMSAKTRGPFA